MPNERGSSEDVILLAKIHHTIYKWLHADLFVKTLESEMCR